MAEKLLINLKFVFYIIETSYPFSSFSNIRAKLIFPFNFSPHFPHFPISIQNLFTFHFQYKIFTSHDCVFIKFYSRKIYHQMIIKKKKKSSFSRNSQSFSFKRFLIIKKIKRHQDPRSVRTIKKYRSSKLYSYDRAASVS